MLSAVETDLNALFIDCKCIRLHSVYQLLSGIKKYEDKGVNVWSEQRSTGLKSVLPISCHFFWHNGQKIWLKYFLSKVCFSQSKFFVWSKRFCRIHRFPVQKNWMKWKKLDEKWKVRRDLSRKCLRFDLCPFMKT